MQHCFKASCIKMLRVLLPTNKTCLATNQVVTGLNVGGKTRNITIQLVLRQCCKTTYTFFAARFSVLWMSRFCLQKRTGSPVKPKWQRWSFIYILLTFVTAKHIIPILLRYLFLIARDSNVINEDTHYSERNKVRGTLRKRMYNFVARAQRARIVSRVRFGFGHKSFFLSVWYPQLTSNKVTMVSQLMSMACRRYPI